MPKTIADIRWIAGWLETRSQFKSDSDPLSPMSRYPRGSAELFFSLFSSLFPIAIGYFRSLDWGSQNPLHLNMYRESRKLDSTILSVQCTYFTILWKWKHTRWAMKRLVYIRHTIANRGLCLLDRYDFMSSNQSGWKQMTPLLQQENMKIHRTVMQNYYLQCIQYLFRSFYSYHNVWRFQLWNEHFQEGRTQQWIIFSNATNFAMM